jgi:hypothetical protein
VAAVGAKYSDCSESQKTSMDAPFASPGEHARRYRSLHSDDGRYLACQRFTDGGAIFTDRSVGVSRHVSHAASEEERKKSFRNNRFSEGHESCNAYTSHVHSFMETQP